MRSEVASRIEGPEVLVPQVEAGHSPATARVLAGFRLEGPTLDLGQAVDFRWEQASAASGVARSSSDPSGRTGTRSFPQNGLPTSATRTTAPSESAPPGTSARGRWRGSGRRWASQNPRTATRYRSDGRRPSEMR